MEVKGKKRRDWISRVRSSWTLENSLRGGAQRSFPAWRIHARGGRIAAMRPQTSPPGRTSLPGGFQHPRWPVIGETHTPPLQMSGRSTAGGTQKYQTRSWTNSASGAALEATAPPVGRGRQTPTPEWISSAIGRTTPAVGGLL